MYGELEFNCRKRLSVDYTGRGFTRYRKSEADQRGFQRCVTVAAPNRAIKRFEMTDPWPFKESQGVRSRGGAGGTFRLEPEPPGHIMRSGSHIRSWDIFPGAGVRATQNFTGFASIPEMRSRSQSPSNIYLEVESKPPGYLTQRRSPGRNECFPGLQTRSLSRNEAKLLI